eukprot:TRINITY_DN775_c0_g1_i1.p1 TRINITY_DN775_c0_g1~~TRINITY_DN775_c0_g1_i1.p1  ORF type:complete len:456 (+),score=145.12 TRINITY_DN775_c0_g1_i1:103-1368(+)
MVAAIHMQQEQAFETTRHDEVPSTNNDAAAASAGDAPPKVASSDSDILREIARAIKPPPMRASSTPGANGTATPGATPGATGTVTPGPNGMVTPGVSEEDALVARAMSKIRADWRVAAATAQTANALHAKLLTAAKEGDAAVSLANAIRAETLAKQALAKSAPCVGCVKTEKILAPLSDIIAELDGMKQQQAIAAGITPPPQDLTQAGPQGPPEAAAAAVAAAKAGLPPGAAAGVVLPGAAGVVLPAPCPLAKAAPIAASFFEKGEEIQTEPSRREASDEEWPFLVDSDDEAEEEQGNDFGPDAEELEDEEDAENDEAGEFDDIDADVVYEEEDLSGRSFADISSEDEEDETEVEDEEEGEEESAGEEIDAHEADEEYTEETEESDEEEDGDLEDEDEEADGDEGDEADEEEADEFEDDYA